MPGYVPELGQALFGNPAGRFDMPNYAEALFLNLIEEIRRVYWNCNQKEWEDYERETNIRGITYRPYFWGDDPEEAALPNFVCDGREDVEIRFYKHPGRGCSCNQEMTPDEWVDWYEQCLAVIRRADTQR